MTPEDHATLRAHVESVDQAARAAEKRWGFERLLALIDTELRAKFYRQQAKWRQALKAAYDGHVVTRAALDAVESTSAAMVRAWAAVSQAANDAGHQPIAELVGAERVWEIRLKNDQLVAIVETNAQASALIGTERYRAVYTIAEIGALIDALPELLTNVKATFDGAMIVTSERKFDRSWVREGDAVPF